MKRQFLLLLLWIIGMSVFAQDKFDELQYSSEECVFNLNAPSSVRSVKVRIYPVSYTHLTLPTT